MIDIEAKMWDTWPRYMLSLCTLFSAAAHAR
jgi:hypothetical protein